MIQLKDVLHFYLNSGIDCMFTHLNGDKQRLPLNIDNYPIMAQLEAVPILRPLSSMTEDEMKELYFLVFKRKFSGDNITHRDVGEKNERWVLWSGVDRLFIYKDGDIGADCDLHYYQVSQGQVMAYLLSKGFDLFGLIDSNQAIEKK